MPSHHRPNPSAMAPAALYPEVPRRPGRPPGFVASRNSRLRRWRSGGFVVFVGGGVGDDYGADDLAVRRVFGEAQTS